MVYYVVRLSSEAVAWLSGPFGPADLWHGQLPIHPEGKTVTVTLDERALEILRDITPRNDGSVTEDTDGLWLWMAGKPHAVLPVRGRTADRPGLQPATELADAGDADNPDSPWFRRARGLRPLGEARP